MNPIRIAGVVLFVVALALVTVSAVYGWWFFVVWNCLNAAVAAHVVVNA